VSSVESTASTPVADGAEPTAPLLSVEGLSASAFAGGAQAEPLQDVVLRIPQDTSVGLVGESGSGKSLSALSILRLLPAGVKVTSGAIRWQGEDLLGLSEGRMRSIRGAEISMVFQNPKMSLNPVLTVGEQIAEVIRVHRHTPRKQAKAEAVDLLGSMGIVHAARRANDYPHQFSGGMAQRAALARAMACSPRLLIADEPTTGLDPTVQEDVLELLLKSVRDRHASLLLISHDMKAVAATCDLTVVMYAGMALESGPTAEVLASPLNPYTAALVACAGIIGRGKVTTIPGSVPQRVTRHEGCPFAPRCASVMPVCNETVPPRTQHGERTVACHLR
jgi:oligopeptide/dipeptide ABC transporter ATP-binding protein